MDIGYSEASQRGIRPRGRKTLKEECKLRSPANFKIWIHPRVHFQATSTTSGEIYGASVLQESDMITVTTARKLEIFGGMPAGLLPPERQLPATEMVPAFHGEKSVETCDELLTHVDPDFVVIGRPTGLNVRIPRMHGRTLVTIPDSLPELIGDPGC